MLTIKTFVFNPYQENTYLIHDANGRAIVVDPGMYQLEEQKLFTSYITERELKLERLVSTHCHIDHVLGNKYIYDTFGLIADMHEIEIPVLLEVQNYAPQMGFHYEAAPITEHFLTTSSRIEIGEHSLSVIFAPGHSPGHICLYSAEQGFLIGGDVIFKNSIGRTDLPGGDHQQLLESIRREIYTLPDDTTVYPGHGPTTTIGHEKMSNPFVRP